MSFTWRNIILSLCYLATLLGDTCWSVSCNLNYGYLNELCVSRGVSSTFTDWDPAGVFSQKGELTCCTMLCWGNASYGQLGLGGIDEEIVVEPRTCEFFHGKQVRDVGCGRKNTAFLLEDGTVYTCGCNDLGQLGHEKSRKKPGWCFFF